MAYRVIDAHSEKVWRCKAESVFYRLKSGPWRMPKLLSRIDAENEDRNGRGSMPNDVSRGHSDAATCRERTGLSDFDQAVEYFEANKTKILREHEGEYVAIVGRSIVDHDRDRIKLSDRTYEQFGLKDLFMAFVSSEEEPLGMGGPKSLK